MKGEALKIMKKWRYVARKGVINVIFFFWLFSWIYTSSLAAESYSQPPRPVSLVGGMLLDGYEVTPILDATVVFEGGVIVAVGHRDAVEIPSDSVVIDVGGKTIMPGLIDAHIHLDLIGHGEYAGYYKFLEGTERLHEAFPIAAKQMLRAGVTTGLDLGSPFHILDFRERVSRGEVPGPRLLISGPWITRVELAGVPDEYEVIIKNTEEAVSAVRSLIQAGSDVIKTWEGLTLQDYRAIVTEAHAAGIKVHAHLYSPIDIRNAIDSGVDVFQHVGSAKTPPYEESLVSEIAHKNIPIVQTVSHRIWVYPATVSFPSRLRNPIYKDDMPRDFYDEFQRSFKNFHQLPYFNEIGREIRNSNLSASQFIESGAYIGVGTDAASPLNMHNEAMWREMSALVELGMSPIQVISAATKTNAEIIGQFDNLGTLEVGKFADIVLVDGDPLRNIENLANIEIVIKDGVIWYSEKAAFGPVTEIGYAF